jgi:hypothetical protein
VCLVLGPQVELQRTLNPEAIEDAVLEDMKADITRKREDEERRELEVGTSTHRDMSAPHAHVRHQAEDVLPTMTHTRSQPSSVRTFWKGSSPRPRPTRVQSSR